MLSRSKVTPVVRRISSAVRYLHKSDDRKQHSVKDHVVDKTPITAQLWQMRQMDNQADKSVATSAQKVLSKTVEESKLSLCYNFTTDARLRDLYIDHTGNILIGKLLEDLDALAGNIANKHCCDNDPTSKRLSLVTASVDEIVQRRPISINDDLILTGQVAWVGKSSLDVIIEIHRTADVTTTDGQPVFQREAARSKLLSSFFTYVARNRDTNKAALVNKLVLLNSEEERLFSVREEAANSRKAQRGSANIGAHPEHEALQKLIEAGNAMQDMPALAHPNAVLMRATGLENTVVCQPQNVNTGGRVFGGYIMHRAFDLALATSYLFSGAYPMFLEVDKIAFRRPVDIGDLLRLKSRVIYTSDTPLRPMLVVEVTCQVVRPERASSFVSNTFHFVFGFPDHAPVALRKVLPVSTEEALTLIAGSKATLSSIEGAVMCF